MPRTARIDPNDLLRDIDDEYCDVEEVVDYYC